MSAQSQIGTGANWGEIASRLALVRTALFMPASNDRAVAKAPFLDADLIILDLEDAVPPEAKDMARAAAVTACAMDFGHRLIAIRCNGIDSPHHSDDITAITDSRADIIVVPKVEQSSDLDRLSSQCGKPVIAMIETCQGLYAARDIAAHDAVLGLFAGTNDLASELGIEIGEGRMGLSLALQMIVMAARASGKAAFDGVNNHLDDMTALEAEAQEACNFGFTGKTAIHPRQIDGINRAFSPSAQAIAEARALLSAAKGGAERFRGRMVESMHVAAAEMLLARADGAAPK